MVKSTEQFKLSGSAAELFREVRDDLDDRHGYEHSNAEAMRKVLSKYYREEELADQRA